MRGLALCFVTLSLSACQPAMVEQPKYKFLQPSAFFQNGSSAREPVFGTVPYGYAEKSEEFYTGKSHGALVTRFPVPITKAIVKRGQARFDIFCAPCHGQAGDGNGMIARRGFIHPPSYHSDRLRSMPVGYFFNVITHGYGAMFSHASRVKAEDRWAIVAYIRALQLSQNAKISDLTRQEQETLGRTGS